MLAVSGSAPVGIGLTRTRGLCIPRGGSHLNKQQTTQDRHDSDSSDALSSNGFEEAPLSLDAHVAADSATEPQSLETHTSSDAIISAESTTSPPPPIETEVITLEERMRRLEQVAGGIRVPRKPRLRRRLTIPVAKLVTEMPMRSAATTRTVRADRRAVDWSPRLASLGALRRGADHRAHVCRSALLHVMDRAFSAAMSVRALSDVGLVESAGLYPLARLLSRQGRPI